VNKKQKQLLKGGGIATGSGGGLGALVYWLVGGMGLTLLGEAVAITLGVLIAVFASLGGLLYLCYWLGSIGRSD